MKKIYTLALSVFAALPFAAVAQEVSNSMLINLKSGETVEYVLSDIQNITFKTPGQTAAAYSIAVPKTFDTGWVQKVMVDGKQVAEICREYIKSINAQRDVVYVCDENGRADLTKGMTTLGEAVVWNLTANTATVTGSAAAEAAATVYYIDGEITLAEAGEAVAATVIPDVISDRRGTELNTYTIVKIGTQYWMAENLRATKFTDGTAIEAISESGADAWKANTTGAYLTEADADWVKVAGYLYSGYCVTSEHGIAPEGWAVPSKAELTKLRMAGGPAAANFKASDVGTWAVGNTGTNINGFTAIANGYYSTATNLTGMQTEAYYWSSTTFSDWLTKQTGLETLRINGTATNVVVSTDAGHALPFGHSIRCIRK
ncbi:MAG: fibrobacter succinogenes major paralogous domain-containing protein [Muribaculaceae bacterium]|nr:fibrobacter succinogenes major paralogous domain-containing protein [Muribaculaceae bacterium]